jgi:hypothetical protein
MAMRMPLGLGCAGGIPRGGTDGGRGAVGGGLGCGIGCCARLPARKNRHAIAPDCNSGWNIGPLKKVCSQYVLFFYRKLQENTTGKYA